MRRPRSLFVGCGVAFLMVFPFLMTPFDRALAAESEEERTAKLVEGAKKEGSLLWYATIDVKDGEKILRRFEEKYPFIKAQMYRAGGDAMLSRIMAEARVGKHLWDVTINGGLKGEFQKRKGLFAKYLSPESKFFPKEFKDPEGYWTDMYLNVKVLGYNTKLVSPQNVPKSYEELLDPKWKGKMGLVTNAYYWFAIMLKTMGEEKGLEYMRKLSDQNIQFRTGRTLVTDMVVAGETSLAIALYNERVEEMKAKGAPIDWVPLDPVVPQIHPLGISANAPHPNAARLFVDFILSREGQQVIASCYRIPSRVDVDPIVPRLKQGLKIAPFDCSLAEDYEKHVKMYREILVKRR